MTKLDEGISVNYMLFLWACSFWIDSLIANDTDDVFNTGVMGNIAELAEDCEGIDGTTGITGYDGDGVILLSQFDGRRGSAFYVDASGVIAGELLSAIGSCITGVDDYGICSFYGSGLCEVEAGGAES